MAQYKLIQDIEAEDKILGPLTLRQFLFGIGAAFLFYLCFIVTVKGAAFLLVIFLPPALFCAFFAFPFGRDQPTEVWALAKLRFLFKPRRRVWSQSGVKELVTITVPKKVERALTNGLSQTEVKSRLHILADTLDSRGWAVKNVAVNDTYASPMVAPTSDRLIDISGLPHEVPAGEIMPADDILDEANNPIARQFGAMIDESTRNRRQQLMERLNEVRETEVVKQAKGDNWFVAGGGAAQAAASDDMADDDTLAAELAERASSRRESFGNLRTMRPLASSAKPKGLVKPAAAGQPQTRRQSTDTKPLESMTTPDDPAILSLAKNNDLNVSTLAREARKNKGGDLDGEVVISLH